jgi:hypothetical protein
VVGLVHGARRDERRLVGGDKARPSNWNQVGSNSVARKPSLPTVRKRTVALGSWKYRAFNVAIERTGATALPCRRSQSIASATLSPAMAPDTSVADSAKIQPSERW